MPKDYFFEDEDNLMTLGDDKMEEETWDDGEEEKIAEPGEDDEKDLGLGEEEEEEI
ncbi:MAG: hypothetical protein V1661_02215 [bacterium]